MSDILEYTFAQNALLSMIFLSVLSGVVGTYIVTRRMVFVAGGVTHASFGGIGLAYYMGFNPTLGALLFAIGTAIGVDVMHEHAKVREDSAIAMLWSLGMALGVIFMTLSPGYAPNLMGFMFGDVLAVSQADVVAEGTTAALTMALAIIYYRPLLYVAFDPQYAKLSGWPVRMISLTTSVMMALAISLSIKAVGIILVLSVFTVPQTIAGIYVKSLGKQMVLSGLIALMGCMAGLAISFSCDLPTGAVITALLTMLLLVIKVLRHNQS